MSLATTHIFLGITQPFFFQAQYRRILSCRFLLGKSAKPNKTKAKRDAALLGGGNLSSAASGATGAGVNSSRRINGSSSVRAVNRDRLSAGAGAGGRSRSFLCASSARDTSYLPTTLSASVDHHAGVGRAGSGTRRVLRAPKVTVSACQATGSGGQQELQVPLTGARSAEI